jgi:3-deoxy-D-manno-octulosonic-acid transferase
MDLGRWSDKAGRMSPLYTLYTALNSGFLVTCIPAFWLYARLGGRHGRGLNERLGWISPSSIKKLTGGPRIWIHAVSLGEVNVAAPIMTALKRRLPDCSLILSVTTAHGHDLATRMAGREDAVIFSPIDTLFTVRNALARIRPHILAFLETEIWPAWIVEAHRMGTKIALLNGRISIRSVGRYLKFRPFLKEVLDKVHAFSMIMEEDAERICSLGADPQRVVIRGNAKYDLLPKRLDPHTEKKMREILNVGVEQPVFIAGSTREGEEPMILRAFQRIARSFPDTLLIVAPRHVERTVEIGRLLEQYGFRYQLWSDLGQGTGRTENVVVLNTFGELFELYSIASLVFCGASLVPLGGQNPLEPAIWGKPVFYGPSMEDFMDAKALLETAGAGVPVSHWEELSEKAVWMLNRPDEIEMRGKSGRAAVMKNQHAAERHAEVVANLI